MAGSRIVAPIEADLHLLDAISKMSRDTAAMVDLVTDEIAQLVAATARPKVPVLSGLAAGSIKVGHARGSAYVEGGGPGVEYYPWLDFGGNIGKDRSVNRPFSREGRYIFPAYSEVLGKIDKLMGDALVDLADAAGIEVT